MTETLDGQVDVGVCRGDFAQDPAAPCEFGIGKVDEALLSVCADVSAATDCLDVEECMRPNLRSHPHPGMRVLEEGWAKARPLRGDLAGGAPPVSVACREPSNQFMWVDIPEMDSTGNREMDFYLKYGATCPSRWPDCQIGASAENPTAECDKPLYHDLAAWYCGAAA